MKERPPLFSGSELFFVFPKSWEHTVSGEGLPRGLHSVALLIMAEGYFCLRKPQRWRCSLREWKRENNFESNQVRLCGLPDISIYSLGFLHHQKLSPNFLFSGHTAPGLPPLVIHCLSPFRLFLIVFPCCFSVSTN